MKKPVPIGGMALIKKMVCDAYGIRESTLISNDRHYDVSKPRQVAYLLCRELLQVSYTRIGMAFGGRDHSTIMDGVKKAKFAMIEFPYVAHRVSKIKKDFLDERKRAISE